MTSIIKKSLILLLIVGYSLSYSQIDSLYQDMEFSLLTCKSGDELYSTFGHTAIRMNSKATGSDIVFNYGTFDTDAPYFYIKFLRGQLPYKLTQSPYSRFLRAYQYFNRSVIEQKLYLTLEEKKSLSDALIENIKPENSTYPYDFFFDNCTTRAIDKIIENTGKLDYKNQIKDITYREMLKENLTNMPWSEFGIDLIIGAKADKKTNRSQQYFLPMYLHDGLNDATRIIEQKRYNIASTDHTVLNYDDEDMIRKSTASPWPIYILLSILLFEVIMTAFKIEKVNTISDKIWMWLLGILALVMAFMWWGTDHRATNDNYNLIWANLLFIPYLISNRRRLTSLLGIILIICCILTIINTFYQFLPQYFHPGFGVIALISIIKIGRNLFFQYQYPLTKSSKA